MSDPIGDPKWHLFFIMASIGWIFCLLQILGIISFCRCFFLLWAFAIDDHCVESDLPNIILQSVFSICQTPGIADYSEALSSTDHIWGDCFLLHVSRCLRDKFDPLLFHSCTLSDVVAVPPDRTLHIYIANSCCHWSLSYLADFVRFAISTFIKEPTMENSDWCVVCGEKLVSTK